MKKESVMQKLFTYAGNYKYLTIASWILSATSALIALLPFYYIWRIMQEVVLAAPDYSKAQNLSGLGWSAVGFALLSRPTWRISCRIKLERWQHLWDCCFCW